MAAIRILQERLNKSQVKSEFTQITGIRTPPPPPDSPIIKKDTPVYAVWFDDDGLVYKVR
jgi:hypothetical protein